MTTVDIYKALADKYSPDEVVDLLNVSVDVVISRFEDEIMAEFCEGGAFEDEWRDFYEV